MLKKGVGDGQLYYRVVLKLVMLCFLGCVINLSSNSNEKIGLLGKMEVGVGVGIGKEVF